MSTTTVLSERYVGDKYDGGISDEHILFSFSDMLGNDDCMEHSC